MLRNIILFVASAGILAVLFLAYQALVPQAPEPRELAPSTVQDLPRPQPVSDEGVNFGPVNIPPGQGHFSLTRYGRNGKPLDDVGGASWRRVPGSRNRYAISEPTLTTRLPSGMVASITAKEAEITAERVEDKRIEPKLGWLAGDVRIAIDRQPASETGSPSDRPEDQIEITTDRLDFDLQTGELRTKSRILLRSAETEIAGEGLTLVWNRDENRVETLVIDWGEQITMYLPADSSSAAAATSAPSKTDAAAASEPPRRRPPTTYACTLDGDVEIERVQCGERTARIDADGLLLLFDVGGGAGDVFALGGMSRERTRHSRDSGNRLTVRWSGPLELTPVQTPRNLAAPRRHFFAAGNPVRIQSQDRTIECGLLEYREESKRLWLSPAEHGRVELTQGDRLAASADNIFIDQAGGIVKMIGEVKFGTHGPQGVSVACEQWAEIRLGGGQTSAPTTLDPLAAAGDSGPIQSTLFVGKVRVGLQGQKLQAERLETFFKAAAANERLPELLDRAIATGDVRLSADEVSTPRWLRLVQSKIANPLASVATSLGAADQQRLECGWLEMRFGRLERAVPGSNKKRATVFVRELSGLGDVRLRDPQRGIDAKGRRIVATFADERTLSTATVFGTPRDWASLSAETFRLRGPKIDFDGQAEIMQVNGPSRLSFAAQRSLRGERRQRPVPIVVTCAQSLTADSRRNTIDFVGQVSARTGAERLNSDSLTILLEDVAPPATQADRMAAMWRTFKRALATGGKKVAPLEAERSSVFLAAGNQQRGRKEPIRLIARNALVQSEITALGDPLPLLHQSIAAPEMNIDVRTRGVRTSGETTLLMTDRRLTPDAESARQATGLPSALLTRGPHQTAMRCTQSMVYVVGDAGEDRRDSVLFEGNVKLRHVAGSEMIDFNTLFPNETDRQRLMTQLKPRDTQLECDRMECSFQAAAPGQGQPGGPSLRLTWINARGNAYLRDKQGDNLREVYAHQMEFDRQTEIVRVLGSQAPPVNARIYTSSAGSGLNKPAEGPEFIIDLKSNTVRAGATSGEFRRR